MSAIFHSHSPDGSQWDDAKDIVKATWPELVEKGLLPCTGSQPTKKTLIDARATEKLLGMQFQGFGPQIQGLFKQWIPYVERDGAAMAQRIL